MGRLVGAWMSACVDGLRVRGVEWVAGQLSGKRAGNVPYTRVHVVKVCKLQQQSFERNDQKAPTLHCLGQRLDVAVHGVVNDEDLRVCNGGGGRRDRSRQGG